MANPVRDRSIALLAFAAIFVTADVHGEIRSWTAVSSGDWSVASYWSGDVLPTATDAAYIVNGGTATIAQTGAVCSQLILGGSKSGTIQMTSGGVQSIADGLFLGNVGGASGTYIISAGSLYSPNVEVSGSGPGLFAQSGGTCSISIQLDVGYDTGSSGTCTLGGNGLLSAWHEVIGDVANGTFVQSGGTNSVSTGLVLGQNPGCTGAYNLNGGLLILGGNFIQVSGSAAFSISGGTLLASSSGSLTVPTTLGVGNAVVDTGGSTLRIAAALSGSGRLIKSGEGLLVLSGSNSYSGGTAVSAGTLEVLNPYSLRDGSSLTVGAGAIQVFGAPLANEAAITNLQPVPEPSTIGLLGIGAAGFFAYRRLRNLKRRFGNRAVRLPCDATTGR